MEGVSTGMDRRMVADLEAEVDVSGEDEDEDEGRMDLESKSEKGVVARRVITRSLSDRSYL